MERMTIPGTNYTIDDNGVYFRTGRKLKADRRNVYKLRINGNYVGATFGKWMFCAKKSVPIGKIGKEYSFSNDGEVRMLSDVMSGIRKVQETTVKVQRSDYEETIEFAKLAIAILDGEPDAKRNLFRAINRHRDDIIGYARSCLGGRGFTKAEQLADDAILHTFETIERRVRAVPSPIGYAKRTVRGFIYRQRKFNKSSFNDNKLTEEDI